MENRSVIKPCECGSDPRVTYRARGDDGSRSVERCRKEYVRRCDRVSWLATVAILGVAVLWATPVLAKKNLSSNQGSGSGSSSSSTLINQVVLESGICPIAFHQMGSKCYFYGYFPLNWYRAAEFCHSFGQDVSLAAIETARENYYIKNWLSVNGNHHTGVWVGGSDNGHNGKWAWFPTGQLVDYSNWGPSQPSGGDQHCMYMVGGLLGYQWADFHCDFDMNFLCEYRVNNIMPWR